jgi:uridine kinase
VRDGSISRQRQEDLADEVLGVAADTLERLRGRGGEVTVVAIDGEGASGKSTIARQLCALSGASLVHTDDFFTPRPVSTEGGVAGLGSYYDIARLRAEALEPLRAGREAVFHAFDWETGTLSSATTRVGPAGLVVLEGVYSSSSELADLVDKAVYVDTPELERLGRLRERVTPEEWDSEWLRAEKEYFAVSRPMESFDLVIRGSRATPLVRRGAHAPVEGRRVGGPSSEQGAP